MKKFVISLLAASLVFSCCACGGTESGASSVAASSVTSETTGTVDETTTETNPEETVDRSQFKIKSFNTEPTIEETVLVDESGVKITATGLEYTDYEAILHVKIENNTESEIDVLANGGASVNNYMVPAYMHCNVLAHDVAENSVDLDYDELELYGIYQIAEIGIHFAVDDDDLNELADITSYVKTSIAETYVFDTKSYQNTITDPQTVDQYNYEILNWSADTVFDQYGVQFVSELFMKNVDGERALMIEVYNGNDVTVSVGFEALNINGDEINNHSLEWDDIDPGKYAIMSIDVDGFIDQEDELDAEKYTDISQIKFNVNIYSNDQTFLEDEPLTLSFS